jgi:hypothetical protein
MPKPIRIILIVNHPKRPSAMMVSRLSDDWDFRFIVWFSFMRISRVNSAES